MSTTMTSADTYNGYTNYETWAVSLWIDNDQGSQEYWNEQAQAASGPADLADQLRVEHDEALPELQGFAADLLSHAMHRVNWFEIAQNMIQSAQEG